LIQTAIQLSEWWWRNNPVAGSRFIKLLLGKLKESVLLSDSPFDVKKW